MSLVRVLAVLVISEYKSLSSVAGAERGLNGTRRGLHDGRTTPHRRNLGVLLRRMWIFPHTIRTVSQWLLLKTWIHSTLTVMKADIPVSDLIKCSERRRWHFEAFGMRYCGAQVEGNTEPLGHCAASYSSRMHLGISVSATMCQCEYRPHDRSRLLYPSDSYDSAEPSFHALDALSHTLKHSSVVMQRNCSFSDLASNPPRLNPGQ